MTKVGRAGRRRRACRGPADGGACSARAGEPDDTSRPTRSQEPTRSECRCWGGHGRSWPGVRLDGDRGREGPQADGPTARDSGRFVGRRARSEGLAVQGPSLVGTPDLPSAWSELPGRLRVRRRGARRSGPQRSADDGALRFVLGMLESAAAPTNVLLGNPPPSSTRSRRVA